MAMEPRRNRRVTYAQLEALWEVLNRNRSIATGYNKTAQARVQSQRMWEAVANNLNSFGDGAVKDWKSWCKYWNDYKSKLKMRVASLRRSHGQTGGGPATDNPLSEMEKKFLQIMGEGFGSGLPGIRMEPFEEVQENITEAESSLALDLGAPSVGSNVEIDEGSERVPAQQDIPLGVGEARAASPQAGPSTRRDSSRVATPTPQQPRESPPHTPHRTPRRTPRRTPLTPRLRQSERRQRRRLSDPPITMEAARRSLMLSSQRRVQIAERKAAALENLVEEIREMKNIFLSRFPLPPTSDE